MKTTTATNLVRTHVGQASSLTVPAASSRAFLVNHRASPNYCPPQTAVRTQSHASLTS